MRIIAIFIAVVALAALAVSGETSFVEYDIDGTAKYVDVTWNSGTGSTEQKRFKLPVHESFRIAPGGMAYVSAQKVRVTRVDPAAVVPKTEVIYDGVQGDVHVAIHINWKLAGEATADAPFGIATASKRVE